MDGLPKNKKPWGKAQKTKQIALDDYLFGRKLQEVYDKKQASNDMPALLKKAGKSVKKAKMAALKVVKRKKPTLTSVKKSKKPSTKLIDAPFVAPKKFKISSNKLHKTASKTSSPSKKVKPGSKKLLTAVLASFLVAVIAFAILKKPTTSKKDTTKVQGATSAQKPDFEAVLPKNAPQDKIIKFDPTKRVASFEDTIQGSRIVVSQQKLGETEIKDTEFLKRTATNFNLKTELTTLKGTAYIGVNIEKNVQIAVFIYKDFLFFIQTEITYKNQVIIDYIQSLQ